MLKGISPVISPDLLKIMAEMGHGDELVLADAHFPGHTLCKRVVRADGIRMPDLLEGIIPLFDLDRYADPLIMMAAVEGDRLDPAVEARYLAAIRMSAPDAPAVKRLERFAFYERAAPALLLAALLTAAPCVPADPSRPNIVILLADDLGWGDPGCYGATLVKTPNIDRLAAEGMRFTDAHSPASVCTPSRYNLMTGRYAWRTHAGTGCVWDDPLLIETSRLTLASMLKARGYATGIVGKWHLGLGNAPENQADWRGMDWNGEIQPGPLEVGFDEAFFRPAIGGPAPQVYVNGHRVAGLDPADPLRTTFPANYPGYLAVKRNATNIGPSVTGGSSARFATDRTAVVETSKATAFIEAHAGKPFFLYFATHNVHGPVTPGERFAGRSTLGKRGDFIEELDWITGEILQTLERKGVARNTLFLFSSDNGGTKAGNSTGHARNGPWRGFKTEAYEGGHRVPLIIRWPGHVEPGSRSDALVALTDVMATCAEIVGHPLPEDAAEDSISFLPVLLGSVKNVRSTIVCDGWKGDYSIRDGQWKLILPAPDFPGLRATPELYDLGKDPGEQQNVAAQQPETVVRLQALLEQIRKDGRSRPYGTNAGKGVTH